MKIVGQSTLAEGSPYMHLGYAAATNVLEKKVSLYGGSLIGLGLGMGMLIHLLVKAFVSGEASGRTSRRKFARRLILSLMVVAAGFLCFVLGGKV